MTAARSGRRTTGRAGCEGSKRVKAREARRRCDGPSSAIELFERGELTVGSLEPIDLFHIYALEPGKPRSPGFESLAEQSALEESRILQASFER